MKARLLVAAMALIPGQALAQEQEATDHSAHQGHAMQMDEPAGEDHSMHSMPAPADAPAEDQPGNAPAPSVPLDHAADRYFPADRMAAAREALFEHGGFSTLAVQIDRIEYRAAGDGDGYAWEGKAWYGGDIDRLVVASEGEGRFDEAAERVELAGYWRHALDPWFNLELGVRHDFRPDPERTYALIGIEGLAPYWLEVEGQLLVSNKGDVHLRGKAGYDQRITQSIVLEPEVEVDFAFQDVPELRVGSGFERIELGARLRYDANRSFAPFVGVNWERKLGGTADMARSHGDSVSGVSAVVGARAMF